MMDLIVDREVVDPRCRVAISKLILDGLKDMPEARSEGTLITLSERIHRNRLKMIDSGYDILRSLKLEVRVRPQSARHEHT
jgi:hypothetical protein